MELTLDEQLNLADYFLDARLRQGLRDQVALIVDRAGHAPERITYGDVARHADRYAYALRETGVAPEQRVLIACEDGIDFVGAFFGVLKMGAVVVMVNPELSLEEARHFLTYTRATIAVVSQSAAEVFARAAEQAPLLKATWIVGDATPVSLARVHLVSDVLPNHPGLVEMFPTHRDDPAIWLFSGGTTGRPKAVAQSHGSFVNTTVLYGQNVLGLRPSDITLSVPKLFFGYATGSNLLFPFSVGAKTILFPERCTAPRLFELIERHKPTVLINVPTMVGKMLDAPEASARDLSSLRIVTSAGEALPEPLFQRFKDTWGIELLDGLGTAEMWHVFVTNRPGQVKPGTLGQAVPGFEVKVCDDQGVELPDGETGFLWVRGRSRALFYIQQHDKSCLAFRGEWYASSDMVRRDADGTFSYCGRSDDMLKVSGKWLSPKEVESCLMLHPAVEECAVIGVSDPAGLIKPCAFIRPREKADKLGAELMHWVRERLAPYKAPREIVFMEQFPRTHLGKVDRGKLRREAHSAGGAV